MPLNFRLVNQSQVTVDILVHVALDHAIDDRPLELIKIDADVISLDELVAHAADTLSGDGILQVGGVIVKVMQVRREDVTRRLDVD